MSCTLKLRSGGEIPLLGFGTWLMEDGTCYKSCLIALEAGYRHIDTATMYKNEEQIGQAIRESGLKREDIFITSKLPPEEHGSENVAASVEESLRKLGTDYLDLYLMHWPIAFGYVDYGENANYRGFANGKYEPWDNKIDYSISIRETWQAMEELVRKGYVKAIGVCNFNVQLLHDLLTYAKIQPSVNQIECHPYLSQDGLIKYCSMRNVVVQAYAPLGTPDTAEKQEDVTLLTNSVLTKIASKYKKSASQVALKWNLMRRSNIVVITKSENLDRISENHSLLDFTLSNKEIEEINQLNRNYRFLRPEEWPVTKDIHLFE